MSAKLKKFSQLGVATVAAVLAFVSLNARLVRADGADTRVRYRSDRVIILPKQGVASAQLQTVQRSPRIRTVARAGTSDLKVAEVEPGQTVEETVQRYQASGLVEFAEPDYILKAYTALDDPNYVNGDAWALNNQGQSGGTSHADINVLDVWGEVAGYGPVTVAIIDSGIRATHEDLAQNLWVNSDEIPGNGIDDDGDGIIDDVHGFNSIAGTGDCDDDVGHGTHVAGIIGAIPNNAKGSVGVARNVKLMALKFLDSSGEGATSDAIQCIDYARAHGAQIINASWGSGAYSQALRRAIDRARADGIIFVAAAGNDGVNSDRKGDYPADYSLDNIVSVAASDRNDRLASFSNYGKTTVDLAAPGVDIYSTWNTSDKAYAVESGTSMAAPFVTGVFALLKARFPDKPHTELIQGLLASVDSISSFAGKNVTGGRLNAQATFAYFGVAAVKPPLLTLNPVVGSPNVVLSTTGDPGTVYQLEVSPDLVHWTPLRTQAADEQGVLQAELPRTYLGQEFYRVVVASQEASVTAR